MSDSVPAGWKMMELGKICDVVGGGTPARENPMFWNGDIPWATPTEITNLKTGFISKTRENISQKGLNASSAKLHPIGTLLLTSRASIGFVAINKVPMATNQGFQSLRCKNGIVNDFLYQYVYLIRPSLHRLSSGSTFSEISSHSIKKMRVTLPPLPEQQKIASILTSVDTVIEKTEAQINKLKDLKKAMMKELLTKGIGHTEFKDSPVGRIPKGWECQDLGEVSFVTKLAGFEYTEHFDYSIDGEIIVIRVLNLKNGKLDLSNIQTIPRKTSESLPRSKLNCGDLVLSYVGTVGEVGFINQDNKYHLAPNVAKISPNEDMVETQFLLQQFLSAPVQKRIKHLSATTSQPSLSMGNLRKIKLPLPPLSEQQKITSILTSVDKSMKEKQNKLTHTKSLKKALMQDLLTGKVRVKV